MRVGLCFFDPFLFSLIIEETKKVNSEGGNQLDLASSIHAQIRFFSCPNVVIDKQYQKDISRYIYCTDLGISPYEGTYGMQPNKWVEKHFIIKNAMTKLEERMRKKNEQKIKG